MFWIGKGLQSHYTSFGNSNPTGNDGLTNDEEQLGTSKKEDVLIVIPFGHLYWFSHIENTLPSSNESIHVFPKQRSR